MFNWRNYIVGEISLLHYEMAEQDLGPLRVYYQTFSILLRGIETTKTILTIVNQDGVNIS